MIRAEPEGSGPAPKASVVVPTLNAGPGFEELLTRLDAQKTGFPYEILVLDSGSTDGTPELARRRGALVHRVPRAGFDHGATRDLGVSLARGAYVAFVVQDALPADDGWLAAMAENLDRDASVAGVYGRQLPRPENSPLVRALVNGWPTASLRRREQRAPDATPYRALPPAEQRALAAFDNVSSCVRRSVWEEAPFGRMRFGEDLKWGKSVLGKGYALVYEPRAAVIHAHERGALYNLRRHYADAKVVLDLFGLAPVPNTAALLPNVLRSSAHLYLRLRREKKTPRLLAPGVLASALKYAFFSQLGSYLAVAHRRLVGSRPGLAARLDAFLSKGV